MGHDEESVNRRNENGENELFLDVFFFLLSLALVGCEISGFETCVNSWVKSDNIAVGATYFTLQ